MLKKDNPYSPGAGRKPVALVGRDDQLDTWESELVRIENGLDSRPMAIHGLRGVGKTVLLSRLNEIALEHDWISVKFEANSEVGLGQLFSRELEVGLTRVLTQTPGRKLLRALKSALSFRVAVGLPAGFSFGIDLSTIAPTHTATGSISTDLQNFARDVCSAGSELGTGFALLIDEAQELERSDLSALCELAHRATQEGWSFVMALAGLPSLPTELAKAKSYAERLYGYYQLSPLNNQQAKAALLAPARQRGVEWEDTASNKVIKLSGGYPYFVQEYGSACWLEAQQSPITKGDVVRSIPLAESQLDAGFFATRWERATPGQQKYLLAMAVDDDNETHIKDIEERLAQSAQSLSTRRAELIRKGIIYSPRQGVVAFTVPLMAKFINRQ